MDTQITLRIILEKPPVGILYALQKGSGTKYELLQKQTSTDQHLSFEFSITIKQGKDSGPNFLGPFVQGPPGERFVYIGIGAFAGQADSPWSRRLKIPVKDISWDIIKQLSANPTWRLETHVPGTGKDGTPSCATVKPFEGWQISKPGS